jgi:PAS domain S-box-containing protein
VKFDDGTVRWLFGDALPEREADGSTLWHGYIADITEHKQAEAIFHGLFDQSGFLAGVLDHKGRLIDVNRTALLVADIPREAVIGKYFPDTPWWSNPQDRDKLIEVLNLAYQGTHASFEAIHAKPTGGHVNVMFNAMPIYLENLTYVAVVGVDITERIQIEQALQSSEERLSIIASSAQDAIIMLDEAGNITFWNEAAERIFGYARAEVIGHCLHTLVVPLSLRDAHLRAFPHFQKTGQGAAVGRTVELAGLRKDGSEFPLEVALSAVQVKGAWHSIGMVRDITERKHYEMQLIESEQRLLAILNVSPIAVRIAINQGGEVVFYNQSYAYLIKNSHPMHDNPGNYYAREEDYREILTELGRGNNVLNRQIKLRIPDGAERWVLASYMQVQYQNKDAVLGWYYDITERIEAEQALGRQLEEQRQVEETLRVTNEEQHAIFDSATSGIALIKDSVIVRCNRKLEEIFGYVPGELDGKSTRLWYPDEMAYQTDNSFVYKEIANGKFHRFERQLTRKDGSLFWARLSGQALDSKDPASAVVEVIDNITFEREAADALLKAKEMAEDAARTKSEFLANMSHEIRTPMNGVLGMLDLLRETDMTPVQLDWLETAHSSGEILLGIINDILDFSKLEAGKFQVEQIDFNLVDLVDDSCAALAAQAHAKGLELNCSLPATLSLRWRGDPLRIRQVLTNLIGNAIKFTGQGEVSVSVTPSVLADGSEELRFEVHDTGIGISEEAQLRLFQSFSQADSTTSRSFGGTGLGLSISKKLVELMGGAIGVNSIPGEGACFWFTLPLVPSESVETAALSYDHYDPSGKRVLIVDDNATNRNILSTYLSRWGVAVSAVDNGSAALMQLQASILQGVTYDLILLDMQMPVMDGLTLAKQLAEIPALAKIPIILLSSGDLLSLADYQGIGIVQHLVKPVRQLQLFEAMVNALQGSLQATPKPARPQLERPSYKGKKVLVVEDNKINQKVIVAKLAKFDIVPDLAENGRLALDKLTQSVYDLILMDCQMPVMDGYIATRELRLLEASKGLPHQTVIALTASAMKGDREKCLAAGMDGYLSKPIVTEQLMDMLARRLGAQPAEITPVLSVEDSTPVIVWDATATLDNLDGDSALLDEMIALFLIEGPKQLSELSRVQAEGNLPALANAAHAIKGTVAQFYAEPAKACALLVEQTARSGQSADYQGMTNALINAVTDLINNLRLAKSPQ